MKRKIAVTLSILLSLILISSCSLLPALLDPLPFEEGVLEDSAYVNEKANLQFNLPEGWEGFSKKEAQQILYDNLEKQGQEAGDAEDIEVDFTAYNRETAATVAISYEALLRSLDLDSYVVKSIEANIAESNSLGITSSLADSFKETIAAHDCKVVKMEIEKEGITLEQYSCYFQIDSYICTIMIIPSSVEDGTDTLEDILSYFSEVE